MDDFRLSWLKFHNFRNYENLELPEIQNLTIFVGPNAIGKTNIIEGIQLMTALESFKNPRVSELMTWGSEGGFLEAGIVSNVRNLSIRLDLKNNRRAYALNNKRKTATELQGLLPAVLFSPDDLTLIKGSSHYKRTALDLLGCQLSKTNRVIKRDYDKLLKHKNSLLKEQGSALLLESVNELLVQSGLQLYRYRIALFKNMATRVLDVYQSITCGRERVELSYIPSWENEDVKQAASDAPYTPDYDLGDAKTAFERALSNRGLEEQVRMRAVVGPHADKIEFFIDGKNASLFGSQGQQRSIVLAWKIAEVGILQELLGQKPILLLDDVMSELDEQRRNSLVELLLQDIQTFVTTTDVSFFDPELVDRAHVIRLEEENNGITFKRS